MYQFSTFSPLATSKTFSLDTLYFQKILKDVIVMTNDFRKKYKLPSVDASDIELGTRLLHLDLNANKDVMQLLGLPRAPTNEFLEKFRDWGKKQKEEE